MFIESTFMRYGHGKAGIVGITLKPETLKTWALSRHICSQMIDNMNSLQEETKDTCQVMHKEEGKSRIQCDQKDRDGIKQKISMCINPLDPSVHPDPIVNVANGAIAPPAVNVDRALSIGIKQVTEFQHNFFLKTSTKAYQRKSLRWLQLRKEHLLVQKFCMTQDSYTLV